jgi:hypothetical protein
MVALVVRAHRSSSAYHERVMRSLLALLLVTAACSGKPSPPDPKQFAAMSEEEKCNAVLPRAKKCQDELMAQQFESLADPGSAADKKVTEDMAKELRKEESFSDEAEALHRTNCAASETYAAAVVACWAQPDCKTFATCVLEKDTAMQGPHAKEPTSPSPSSPSPSGTRP